MRPSFGYSADFKAHIERPEARSLFSLVQVQYNLTRLTFIALTISTALQDQIYRSLVPDNAQWPLHYVR